MTNEIYYPDTSDTTSSGTDQIKITYNIDGSVSQRKDQNTTTVDYFYDNRRRLKAQQAPAQDAGPGVDTTVRTISYGYDELARRKKVTSHGDLVTDPDNTTNVKNQVVFGYDDMGALTTRWDSHSGAATTSGMSQSPNVQLAYDTAATSTIFTNGRRLKQVTYPAGRLIHYTYGSSGGVDDLLHRLLQINENSGGSPGTVIEQYSYNGARRLAIADAQKVNFKLNYATSTAIYGGWDRFGRVKDQFWDGYTDGTTTADVDRLCPFRRPFSYPQL